MSVTLALFFPSAWHYYQCFGCNSLYCSFELFFYSVRHFFLFSLSTTRCEMQLTITTNDTALFMLQHQLQCGSHMSLCIQLRIVLGSTMFSRLSVLFWVFPLFISFQITRSTILHQLTGKNQVKEKNTDFLEKLGSFGKLTFDTLIL